MFASFVLRSGEAAEAAAELVVVPWAFLVILVNTIVEPYVPIRLALTALTVSATECVLLWLVVVQHVTTHVLVAKHMLMGVD